ncbi:MAG: carboxypeptidase regulatory-like domain-containing protein [Vicinamibacterales bacterium]
MNSRRLVTVWVCILLVAWLTPPRAATAQTTTGTIAGTVTDQTGAALPGATLVITNTETGTSRTLTSDENGRYRASGMEPGSYDVSAALQGFQTNVRRAINLTMSQEATLTHVLTVGQMSEQVDVRADAQTVNTTSSTVAQLVDQRQIRELPLNGRDFSELALTSIGVVQTPNTDRSLVRGMGTQFSVAGARPNQVSFLLDGTDISDQGGQSPGSAAGGMLGIDTVREFQVITNNYSAEYGRSAGGIVSAITRSGTNALHGSALLFHRNDALDSRTYFDDPAASIPPLTRNQYGANLGGPLARNRTFFFAGFEGLRQDKGRTTVARVPSLATRNRADISPVVRPFMALYPVPNGDVSGASGLYSEAVTEPSREDYLVLKLDHTFSEKNTASVRYTFDDASVREYLEIPTFANNHANRNQYLSIEWKRLFGGSMVNDFRTAFNRTFQHSTNLDLVPIDESLMFIPGTQFGQIAVTGLSPFGTDTQLPYLVGYNVIQAIENLTWSTGNHTVKVGGTFTRWINNQNAQFQPGGRYQFTSIENFVRGTANNYESFVPGSSPDRYWRQNMFGFYAQDDWRIRQRLTLNLGLRYEFITTPTEKYDRIATFPNAPFDARPTIGGDLFKNPTLKNVAPRIGFAWNVTGDGKTAIRGGSGIFYEPILANIYRTFGNRTPPFFEQASLSSPPFPRAVLNGLPTSQQRLDLLEYNLDSPYVWQYNFTVQREVLPQLSVTVGYVGSRGYDLFRNVESNQAIPQVRADGSYFFPVGSTRRSPLWNAVRMRRTDGRSWYNGFIASATKRFNDGLSFQASYTLGRSYDTGSLAAGSGDFNNGSPPRYADDLDDNYGLSDYDVRHNLAFNYSWVLPFGQNLSGVSKALMAGWQLSGVVNLRSGVPFTPVLGFDRARALPRSGGDGQRPNWAPGYDESNAILGGPDRYFDPQAFVLPDAGTFGNVKRNTLIGPGYATWNMAVFKNIEVGGNRGLQLRFEAFNVLNRANFSLPARTVFSAAGRVENAGEITSIVGTARQIQLGAKFTF